MFAPGFHPDQGTTIKRTGAMLMVRLHNITETSGSPTVVLTVLPHG